MLIVGYQGEVGIPVAGGLREGEGGERGGREGGRGGRQRGCERGEEKW